MEFAAPPGLPEPPPRPARPRERSASRSQQRLDGWGATTGDWLWETDAGGRFTFSGPGINPCGQLPPETLTLRAGRPGPPRRPGPAASPDRHRAGLTKLDHALVAGIDRDAPRQALAGAVVQLSGQTGSRVVVQGVETAGELGTPEDRSRCGARGTC